MATEDARQDADQGNTDKKRLASWTRWSEFLYSIGIGNDPFLDAFESINRTKLLACFAQSVRHADYSRRTYHQMASTTVRTTVDDVDTSFWHNQRPDPRVDNRGKPSCLLSRLYSGYSKTDKPTKQQKSLRAAATVLAEARLGFKPDKIGTHSICSGATMPMYLDKVPVYTVMLIDRWSSDAFLKYIRKQVEKFSHNVS